MTRDGAAVDVCRVVERCEVLWQAVVEEKVLRAHELERRAEDAEAVRGRRDKDGLG